MTDQQSPEPRDPWAPPPPEGRPGDAPGGPGVHEHPTVAEMPGAGSPPPAASGGYAPPTAYGHPASPAPGGYAYPGPATPPAAGGYAYPGPPAPPVQPGYAAYPGYATGYPGYAPGYPGYPGYPQPSNGFGITALVLGVLAIVACPTMFGSVVFGIPAVVFGALGRGKARRGEATNGGVALAGLICGAVGIVIGAVLTLLLIFSPGPFFAPGSGDGDHHGPSSDSQVRERI
ncbi:hypothetical protein GCM10010347_53930 [Streptomyces cirratus]|uniref:DUF4190 domain-containing protein n=1 Tax=Streptomyces cirratus TaxID=68187 RepID=A0ABQ3F4L0_9ACTN|nr:DUF4190 domain-containing protein [Streptomyces cirratus]GHB76756.1 hypothetical protein GCM10010347_53930 [Streptomyces cirratus]